MSAAEPGATLKSENSDIHFQMYGRIFNLFRSARRSNVPPSPLIMCRLVNIYWLFRGACSLHRQGWQLHMLYLEDGGSMLLYKVSNFLPVSTAAHRRTYEFSFSRVLYSHPLLFTGLYFVVSQVHCVNQRIKIRHLEDSSVDRSIRIVQIL
jgi:hypothetical protein